MDMKGLCRVSRSVGGRQLERGVGECGVAGAKGLDPVAGHSLGVRSAKMRRTRDAHFAAWLASVPTVISGLVGSSSKMKS